jgi:hypothetical protein
MMTTGSVAPRDDTMSTTKRAPGSICGLTGEAFVLLGATGEVSALPPQVAMANTATTATIRVACVMRVSLLKTM